MSYESSFLFALFLTLAIEIPVLFFFVRVVFKQKKTSDVSILFAGLVASGLTLPYLWFVIPSFAGSGFVTIGESFAVFAEAIIIERALKLGWKKSLATSLAANVISFVAGGMIFSSFSF
ncbi:MAG TPA: hypothetical protein VGQ00_01745 [Candidatus Norongarragalinales archaeon]|jgi:hypothetical protein|nr:hypothetical protein [Candidatus Norongarragalinales archaeon]